MPRQSQFLDPEVPKRERVLVGPVQRPIDLPRQPRQPRPRLVRPEPEQRPTPRHPVLPEPERQRLFRFGPEQMQTQMPLPLVPMRKWWAVRRSRSGLDSDSSS